VEEPTWRSPEAQVDSGDSVLVHAGQDLWEEATVMWMDDWKGKSLFIIKNTGGGKIVVTREAILAQGDFNFTDVKLTPENEDLLGDRDSLVAGSSLAKRAMVRRMRATLAALQE